MLDFDEKKWLERLSKAGSGEELHKLVEELEYGNFDTLHKDLLGAAKDLIGSLPADLKPLSLAEKYPRIINRIALVWPYPAECEEFLNSLVMDNRGGRQGFPFAVLAEISNLRDFYHDQYHSLFKEDVWSKAHERD